MAGQHAGQSAFALFAGCVAGIPCCLLLGSKGLEARCILTRCTFCELCLLGGKTGGELPVRGCLGSFAFGALSGGCGFDRFALCALGFAFDRMGQLGSPPLDHGWVVDFGRLFGFFQQGLLCGFCILKSRVERIPFELAHDVLMFFGGVYRFTAAPGPHARHFLPVGMAARGLGDPLDREYRMSVPHENDECTQKARPAAQIATRLA